MIVPEHRACDICGQPVYGDMNHGRVRKVYFEMKYPIFDGPAKEYIRSSDIDICEDCWGRMKCWVRLHSGKTAVNLKEDDGSA